MSMLHIPHEAGPMNAPRRACRGGFTLVEMLVVLAIIGVLAALIIPAVFRAVIKAREARIILEVSALNDAVERYKQTHGAYPPDAFDSPPILQHLRKAFPKHEEGNASTGPLSQLIAAQLTPAEALVFWLSQVVKDPRKPLSSLADPDVIFTFAENRLRFTRDITLGSRTVSLYEYLPADAGEAPYVYFAAPYYVSATTTLDNFTFNGETVYPYQSARDMPSGQTNDITPGKQWINPTSFQIICAGLDGEFGETITSPVTCKVFPNGLNYSKADWDNIANFSNNKTFEDNTE